MLGGGHGLSGAVATQVVHGGGVGPVLPTTSKSEKMPILPRLNTHWAVVASTQFEKSWTQTEVPAMASARVAEVMMLLLP